MAQILVVPREYIESLNIPRYGVKRVVIGQLHSIISEHGTFMERDAMEKDPRYKQIIPYQVIRRPSYVPPLEGQKPPEVLAYTRTKKSGEQRLMGKSSIGFGGHIEEHDGKSPMTCLNVGMRREIEEELEFPDGVAISHPEFACLINDETTDVGQVHIGLLYIIDVKEAKEGEKLGITSPDDNIAELRWSEPGHLETEKFENWSQIVLQNLFKVK